MNGQSRIVLGVALSLLLLGCGHQHGTEDSTHEEEGWAFTAWGEQFEIFAESDPLVATRTAQSHIHVTSLSDFSPLVEGVVSVVLRSTDGTETVFSEEQPLRDGIYSIAIEAPRPGEFDLAFRVSTVAADEEIAAGRVRIGAPGEGSEILSTGASASSVAEEPVSFLKEQQWRTEFATAWALRGSIRESVRGPGRVRPVAGGEVILTAPVDGVVGGNPWPFTGFGASRGSVIFRLTPRVAAQHSLAELEAEVSRLETQLETARWRSERLAKLLALEAVSRREDEEARAKVATLEATLGAARGNLSSAKRVRRGDGSPAEEVTIAAPFAGRIARVDVTPGEAVSAGTPLARWVRVQPLWVEVALRPSAATALSADPVGLLVRGSGMEEPHAFSAQEIRLISKSPVVDLATGTVAVLLELAAGTDELHLGSAIEAEILLPEERSGIVIPASALVDDGGVSVVYVQIDGESFLRREVAVLARQGGSVLVEGLAEASRLVTQGGNAIRRATLVASDPGEGHVH